jgi:predicted TIM-barrel fold metal-dependent hydrolase
MCIRCTRRTFLGAIAASAFTSRPGLAQISPSGPAQKIDVHYHLFPSIYFRNELVQKALSPTLAAMSPSQRSTAIDWSPERTIDDMDANGIATIVASAPVPGVWLGDESTGRRLARQFNDYVAELKTLFKGRFGLFAPIPLPDINGSLTEIEYSFDTLGVEGIGLFTSYGDKSIADTAHAPVFEELNRRKSVVYVHPVTPQCCRNVLPGIPGHLIEYPMDTLRAIVMLIAGGSLQKYPDIKFIFSHSGGLLAGAYGRLTALTASSEPLRRNLPQGLKAGLMKLYFEISNSADATSFTALTSFASTSNILFGTDSPFSRAAATNEEFQKLDISIDVRRAIEFNNATMLMPSLRL